MLSCQPRLWQWNDSLALMAARFGDVRDRPVVDPGHRRSAALPLQSRTSNRLAPPGRCLLTGGDQAERLRNFHLNFAIYSPICLISAC
jgi:hypothetical protein